VKPGAYAPGEAVLFLCFPAPKLKTEKNLTPIDLLSMALLKKKSLKMIHKIDNYRLIRTFSLSIFIAGFQCHAF